MLAPLLFVGGVGCLGVYAKRTHEDIGTGGFPLGYFGQQGRLGPTLNTGLNTLHHPGAVGSGPTINYHSSVVMPEWAGRVYREHRINHTARSTHWSGDQAKCHDHSRLPLNISLARHVGLGSTSSQFVLDEKHRYEDMSAYYGGRLNTAYWDPHNYTPVGYLHNPSVHEFQNS